jgi:aminopeptidase-like protein
MTEVSLQGSATGEAPWVVRDPGNWMHGLIRELYPICRSITGEGVRRTLAILQSRIPVSIFEIPSGTQAFDWVIPKEWNVRDAYIRDSTGKKVVDFQKSNLHLVGYSRPVHRTMSWAELQNHLFTLPDKPDWFEYRTTFYTDNWGFCLSHNDFLKLGAGDYEVCVNTTLEDGSLSYGECFIPGETSDEVLISAHVCHPSLCNDNLSGIVLAACLARFILQAPRRYSYRFLFAPATIGAIAWLARNEADLDRIHHGLVLSCVGDSGCSTYKQSRRGSAEIDRSVAHVLRHSGAHYEIRPFTPSGYDERQFCSPGINLPVGSLLRTPNGAFEEYHTSADNLDFVTPAALADSYEKCVSTFGVLEGNQTYLNLNPKGEPRLAPRGLYAEGSQGQQFGRLREAILWVLNMSDGSSDLLSIAERSGIPFHIVRAAADMLVEKALLREHSTRVAL